MNSDPKVVHYVNDSGHSDFIFRLIKGNLQMVTWHEPDIPPISELIMSLPNAVMHRNSQIYEV